MLSCKCSVDCPGVPGNGSRGADRNLVPPVDILVISLEREDQRFNRSIGRSYKPEFFEDSRRVLDSSLVFDDCPHLREREAIDVQSKGVIRRGWGIWEHHRCEQGTSSKCYTDPKSDGCFP